MRQQPAGFISDDEMAQLEANTSKPAGFISDADMDRMEASLAELNANTAASLDKINKEAQSQGGQFESMLRGFAQNATLGAADDLVGLGAAIIPGGKSFTEARDAYRAGNDLAWDVNPVQYGTGAVAALAPQIVAAPVVGGVRGLATGAGLGGVGGLAGSEAKTTGGIAADTLIGTGLGGLFGGLGGSQAAQKTGQAVGKGLNKAADFANDAASGLALADVGIDRISKLDDIGRFEQDLTANLLLGRGGNDRLLSVSKEQTADNIGRALAKLQSKTDEFGNLTGEIDWATIKPGADSLNANSLIKLAKDVKDATKPQPDNLARLVKSYGTSAGLGTISGGVLGGGLGLVAPAAWDKVGRYGAAIAADNLANILRATPEKLGKYANTLSKIADERGPQALRATHFVLMQNNPDYRAMFTESEESNGPE